MTTPRPSDFAALFHLDEDDSRFVSRCGEANLTGNAFGGQLMAQAVVAAAHGLDPRRRLRSLHAGFFKPVPLSPPPVYDKAVLLHGRTFSNLEVRVGTPGQLAFSAQLCFQAPEVGPQHQASAPQVPLPTTLLNLAELADRFHSRLSEGNRRLLTASHLHELRPVDAEAFLFCGDRQPSMRYWMRSSQAMDDEPLSHEAALVYMSDAWVNSPMLMPHVATRMGRDFFAPTLTHDLWLHRSFRADEWLLFDLTSPSLAGAAGLVLAAIYDGRGQLVANAAQHALFRRLG